MTQRVKQAGDFLGRLLVRGALVGGSVLDGNLFWTRAVLGRNQLHMHDCTPDGSISIGDVPEQLYGEGFLAAWHEVLARELGPRAAGALYEVGHKGACWEVRKAIEGGVWVPRLLRPLVGRPELLERIGKSAFARELTRESLRILFRMIMTEGGWGRVDEIDLVSRPMRVVVANLPEPRRLGHTGRRSCFLAAGIYAGYFETIFGTPFQGRETTCRSNGDEACAFELSAAPAPKVRRTRKVRTPARA